MWRQGDLLFVPMTRRESNWIRSPKTDVAGGILALGEVTGHSHRVTGNAVAVYDTERYGRVIDAKELFEIVHEEHAPITLPPGAYRVIRQREFDETNDFRYVSD
jgi:hypothetical protein